MLRVKKHVACCGNCTLALCSQGRQLVVPVRGKVLPNNAWRIKRASGTFSSWTSVMLQLLHRGHCAISSRVSEPIHSEATNHVHKIRPNLCVCVTHSRYDLHQCDCGATTWLKHRMHILHTHVPPCWFENPNTFRQSCNIGSCAKRIQHPEKQGFGSIWSIIIYHDLSWSIMIYHDLSWSIMIYHDLSYGNQLAQKPCLKQPTYVGPGALSTAVFGSRKAFACCHAASSARMLRFPASFDQKWRHGKEAPKKMEKAPPQWDELLFDFLKGVTILYDYICVISRSTSKHAHLACETPKGHGCYSTAT